jgi:dTDP-4-amino-4,6-dideoxygalactose transaminase
VKVPLLDLQPQYAAVRDEALAAITRVCDAQQFVNGPECDAFEAEVARWVGVRHAIGVSSGTDALLVVLMALGVGRGDEVVVPTFSFFATAEVVVRLGATPVFVDIDPVTYTMAPGAVRRVLSPRTRAVVPVHLYGLCAEMEELRSISREADVPLVEDAAQAIGATCTGRQAGALGVAGCFSFYPTKNLGGFGDGGLVTTDDDGLAARVRLLRDHGASRRYYHDAVGGNFRLDALQAAVLRVKLVHLARWNAERRRLAARYHALLEGVAPVVSLPDEPAGRMHTYHQFVLRARNRDGLREHLAAHGVGTGVYYPVPFHQQPCLEDFAGSPGAYAEAERAAREVLALPMFPGLTDEQVSHVASVIAGYTG